MAAPARSRARREAAAPAVTEPQSGQELMLAFAALELRLSGIVQQALVADLESPQARRRFQAEAHRLIDHLRVDLRQRAREVLEAAYGDGAKLAGARPPGAIKRAALDSITESASLRLHSALDTIGRQFDDAFRRVGLQQAARQLEKELPEHAAADVMRRELMKRGMTGFVDRAGRNWRLSNYSRMVIRTTTSEAGNRGVADAALAVGRDLVEIPNRHCHHHPDDPTNPCRALEGKVVSLSGRTPGYPVLFKLPPFHPYCEHGIKPAREP
jgi:hypothetical protein